MPPPVMLPPSRGDAVVEIYISSPWKIAVSALFSAGII